MKLVRKYIMMFSGQPSGVMVGVALNLLILSAGILAENPPAMTPAEKPLAIVNGDTISTSDMDTLLIDVHSGMNAAGKIDFDYRRLLDKSVNDRLILQEAAALGMDEEPRVVHRLDSLRRRKAIAVFVADRYRPDLSIAEDEITSYFNIYYARLQLRTVAAATLEEAETIAAAIRTGASMDSIASEVSLDMYRLQGGLHNFKYYGDTEIDLRTQAEQLSVGELSATFPYREVWSLVRLERQSAADPEELTAYRQKIERVLKNQKHEQRWERFVEDLEAVYPVIEDPALLAAISADSLKLFTPDFVRGTEQTVFRVEPDLNVDDTRFRTAISRTAMTMGTAPFDSMMTTARRQILEELVLWAAARAAGYAENPTVIRTHDRARDSLLLESYLQETVIPQIVFRRDEFSAYYQEHIDEFREPTKFQFDRLMADDDSTAQEISGRLQNGADFHFIGRQYNVRLSTPEEAAEWLSLESFPASIQQEISGLSIGQSTAPHPTTDGRLILRLKARREGNPKPLADVEMSIREVMFQRKFAEILDRTLNILKENSAIEYIQPNIDEYFKSGG